MVIESGWEGVLEDFHSFVYRGADLAGLGCRGRGNDQGNAWAAAEHRSSTRRPASHFDPRNISQQNETTSGVGLQDKARQILGVGPSPENVQAQRDGVGGFGVPGIDWPGLLLKILL